MLKKITSRKTIIVLVLVAACGGGFFVYKRSTSDATPTYTTTTVQKGTLIVSVSGSGSMAAKNTADVNPGISGEVTKIYVAEGDVVKKGQVLMSIKNDDLPVASSTANTTYLQAQESLEKARLDKESAEEDLEQLKKSSEADLAKAYTTYLQAQEALKKAKLDKDSATESLAQLKESSDADEAKAYTTYLQAQEALKKAKLDKDSATEALEELQEEDEDDPDSVSDLEMALAERAVDDAELAIQAAEDKVTSTNLAYEAAKSDLGIKTAEQAVDDAELAIQAAEDKVTSTDLAYEAAKSDLGIKSAEQAVKNADLAIKSAEDKVSSTKLAYDEAKEEADKRQVKASIAGTITSLDVEIGDELEGSASSATGGSGGFVLTIVNLENLVAQIDINEIDALNVKKEQKATLTFDVFDEEKKFTGKVTKVDTLGTTTQGVTTYQAEVTLDSIESSIKPGMTVTADIITESKENVLLVANSAIKTAGEQNYVQVLADDGTITNVTVEIGLASNEQTEITSGLSEGDKVVTAISTAQGTTNASFDRGGLNIMQFGGPGGGEVRGVMR